MRNYVNGSGHRLLCLRTTITTWRSFKVSCCSSQLSADNTTTNKKNRLSLGQTFLLEAAVPNKISLGSSLHPKPKTHKPLNPKP